MRTTLNIADDVYEAARALARGSNRTLGDVLSEMARKGMAARRPIRYHHGLPTFDVPDDAPIIPIDRAAELLAEEGLD